MEPRVAAQIQAEETYSDFIAWSKTASYQIVAILIILTFSTLGQIEQEANTTAKSMPP